MTPARFAVLKICAVASLLFFAAASSVLGAPVQWNFTNVTFDDTPSGILTGFLMFDATTGQITTWDITASGGTLDPFNYTPSSSNALSEGATVLDLGDKTGNPNFRHLSLSFGALTAAGTTVTISTSSYECYNCEPFRHIATGTLVTAPPTTKLSITNSGTLGEIALGGAISKTFTATGGTTPYTWSSTTLPGGLTLDPQGGTLSGTPTQPGNSSFTVTVTDSATTPATATVSATLQVIGITTPTPLPPATVNKAYSATFAALGGSGSYAFSSGNPPPGLKFSGSALTGTPTTAGTYSFTVQVTDGGGINAANSFTLVVSGPLSITSSGSLGEIALGTAISTTLVAGGGTPPYTWSAPGLPGGMSLNTSAGALGGTPTQPGNYNFTAQVTDSATTPATATLALTLQDLGFTIPNPLPGASVVSAYSLTFAAAGGTGPYKFSVANPPAGLSFSGATLSGTPNAVGTFNFTAGVTDSSTGFSTSSSFSLVVSPPGPLSVSGGPLPGGKVGNPYSQTLTGTGGKPPYSWTIIGGALPAGLSLDGPSGVVSGTPSSPGPATFNAQATDGLKATAAGIFTITIAPQPLTITGLPFSNGIVGSDYPLQVLSGSGGSNVYTFSQSGTTPPGLFFDTTTGQISGIPTSQGTYSFSITITDTSSPTPLTVTTQTQIVIASAANANLILSAGSLSFNLTTGAAGLPPPYSVTVLSSVVQQLLNLSVVPTPAVSWLDVTGGGTTPNSIGVALDPTAPSLPASSTPLTTSVVVTCLAPSPCAGSTQTIGVSLSVTSPPPQLKFITTLVQFTTLASVSTPISQQASIQNIGGGSAVITSATAADGFITLSGVPASVPGGSPVNITLTANPAGLTPGFYRTTVTIESSGGTISVPVSLQIAQSPSITLSTSGAQFESTLGSPPGNTSGSFQVGVSGGSSLSFTASVQPGAPWLLLSGGSSGTATSSSSPTVSYTIDPVASAALTPAQAYYGTIEIDASGVANSPQNYQVILNVGPANTLPSPDPEPAGLVFQSILGSAAPTAQTVKVYSGSPTAVTYSASANTTKGGSWLTVSPSTGSSSVTSPGVSTVSVTPGTLAAGSYTGTVSYQFSAAAVRSVNVTMIIEPVGGATSTGARQTTSSLSPDTTATCTPAQLVPTQTGLVNNFAQPTSWPTPLSIKVLNNCGSAIGNGQVVATFSNGDPPLALGLVNGGSGLYSGTWTPRATSQQVTVTATATAPGFTTTVARITGQVIANSAPLLAAGGTLHIYNPLVGGAIGQGTILQIYGTAMGAGLTVGNTATLATKLGGTQVLIGGYPAPLYFVSPGQIDAQLPSELTPGNSYQIVINANGALSTPDTVRIAAATPGLASYGAGLILAQHGDNSLVSETNPAVPGEYLVTYLAGLGQTGVSVADGAPSPVPNDLTLLSPLAPPTLLLNGTSIPIYFSGLSPGFVGLYQMNFQVPLGTPNGDLQLVVSQNGLQSNSVILPVHN